MTGGAGTDRFIVRTLDDSSKGRGRDVTAAVTPGADLIDRTAPSPCIVCDRAVSRDAPRIIAAARTGILQPDLDMDLRADIGILLENRSALPSDAFRA